MPKKSEQIQMKCLSVMKEAKQLKQPLDRRLTLEKMNYQRQTLFLLLMMMKIRKRSKNLKQALSQNNYYFRMKPQNKQLGINHLANLILVVSIERLEKSLTSQSSSFKKVKVTLKLLEVRQININLYQKRQTIKPKNKLHLNKKKIRVRRARNKVNVQIVLYHLNLKLKLPLRQSLNKINYWTNQPKNSLNLLCNLHLQKYRILFKRHATLLASIW